MAAGVLQSGAVHPGADVLYSEKVLYNWFLDAVAKGDEADAIVIYGLLQDFVALRLEVG